VSLHANIVGNKMERLLQRTVISSEMAKAVASRHMTTGRQLYATGVTWNWIRARTYQKMNGKSYGKTPIGKR
jgi:NADH:ubiquinone oxidoreductase subunit D